MRHSVAHEKLEWELSYFMFVAGFALKTFTHLPSVIEAIRFDLHGVS